MVEYILQRHLLGISTAMLTESKVYPPALYGMKMVSLKDTEAL